MKKRLFFVLILGLLINPGFAQTINFSETKSDNRFSQPVLTVEIANTPSVAKPSFLNNINAKAAESFAKTFRHPVDVRWTVLPGGFRVQFYQDGIQHRIFYNNNGRLSLMIRYYRENNLSFAVRKLVKDEYFDFRIGLVIELSGDGKIIYLIKMYDNLSWKTVRVEGDEMEVVEEFLRADNEIGVTNYK